MTDLPALASRISATIEANEAAMRTLDRVDRIRLLPLTDKLRRYRDRAMAGIAEPHRRIETETLLGPNMRGPAIDDLIHQCEANRLAAAVERSRRADERSLAVEELPKLRAGLSRQIAA